MDQEARHAVGAVKKKAWMLKGGPLADAYTYQSVEIGVNRVGQPPSAARKRTPEGGCATLKPGKSSECLVYDRRHKVFLATHNMGGHMWAFRYRRK